MSELMEIASLFVLASLVSATPIPASLSRFLASTSVRTSLPSFLAMVIASTADILTS